jgi:hypothetical protein
MVTAGIFFLGSVVNVGLVTDKCTGSNPFCYGTGSWVSKIGVMKTYFTQFQIKITNTDAVLPPIKHGYHTVFSLRYNSPVGMKPIGLKLIRFKLALKGYF